jgi:branched-chain amino acid transport system permease protein
VAIARSVTYVPKDKVFEPHLTIRANVEFLLRLAGGPVAERLEVERSLRDADIPDREINRGAAHCSGATVIRAWLALAQLRSSLVVLLDEPSRHLNSAEASQLAAQVRDRAAGGVTMVVATADGRFAEECAPAVHRLESGRVVSMTRSPNLRPASEKLPIRI